MFKLARNIRDFAGIKSLQEQMEPAKAYDLWSSTYDDQPKNLMLHLDKQIISILLDDLELIGKSVADIGCGTGRHWSKVRARQPSALKGFDISEGMLKKLKDKYPHADTECIKDNLFLDTPTSSYDLILSTLTIAHIRNVGEAIKSWCRILKYSSDIIITDFHPTALGMGGKRTFLHNSRSIAVENHIHTLEDLKAIFLAYGFKCVKEEQVVVDEKVRSFYEEQEAMHVYRQFYGLPIIYGMHLKRNNDPA